MIRGRKREIQSLQDFEVHALRIRGQQAKVRRNLLHSYHWRRKFYAAQRSGSRCESMFFHLLFKVNGLALSALLGMEVSRAGFGLRRAGRPCS